MSFPLTNFCPSWVNSSLPHVGEKVTLISIEEIGKRKKMEKKSKDGNFNHKLFSDRYGNITFTELLKISSFRYRLE